MNTRDQIVARMDNNNTLVCAGIDPNIERMPDEIVHASLSDEEKVARFLEAYISLTAPHICAFKAQKAYFDLFTGGHELLAETVKIAHSHDVPVILDCKIGDIDETMKVYRKNIFEVLKADGVVVNPYMGDDVMLPLGEDTTKLIVPLVQTSNNGAKVVQDAVLKNGKLVWEEMLELVVSRWNQSKNMAPVIASTRSSNGHDVRSHVPDEMLILYAGFGAQGGSTDSLPALLDSKRRGVLVNSSRGLMYPEAINDESWQDAISRSVITMKDQLNSVR